jgi:hypothetical protein
MLYPVALQQRVNNSSFIIQGKVLSSKSFWNADHNNIFTSNLVSVNQILKGGVNNMFIEIITQGGVVEMDMQTVEPSLQLSLDEEGIFMLNPSDQISQYGYPIFYTEADQQGFIKFNLSENKAREPFKTYSSINGELKTALEEALSKSISPFNVTEGTSKFSAAKVAMVPAISSFAPSSITAGTASQLTITGTGFGFPQGTSVVRFQDADNGGGANWITPHATQYISWSATQIVVQVPTRTNGSGTAGSGNIQVVVAGSTVTSGAALTVTHGQLNVLYSNTVTPATQIFNTRHHSLNGAGGMTWRMHTAFNANASAKADFQNAFGLWRCTTFINWQIGTTVSTSTVASDGICVIGFDNAVLPTLPGGVLGVCSSWFSGCTSGTNIAWHVAELDIVFDDATPWHYGGVTPFVGQYDFKSVALHELGHGHQLSHVIDASGVMHWSIASNQTKFTLNANDIAGGNAVMTRNLSGPVCGNVIMTALNAGNCSLAAPVASFNVSSPYCVGQNFTLTDLSVNNPNVWAWTLTGASPATSTLQNPTLSYATPGVKTVTLVSTNGIGSSAAYTKTLNVIAGPTLAVTSATMCPGTSAVLTASGTLSYTWNPSGFTGSVQTLSPGSTTIYTVTGSNGTCANTAVGTLSVLNAAAISIWQSASTNTICAGESVTLTVGGASTYTTNPGAITGSFVVLSPTVTTQYTITGSVGTACNSTSLVTFNVDLCTGVGENAGMVISTVFPNPTSGLVTINFNQLFTGKVNVYNTLGQLIITKSVNSIQSMPLDLTENAKGIYTIRFTSDKKNEGVIKIMKD